MNSVHVRTADAHLFYHDLPGDEPALIMLHGLGSSSSSWYPRATHHPRLRNRRCLLVDFLGFGYSDRPPAYDYAMESQADTVAMLLDHLQLKQSIIVGHSMGGSIAILLADARPELVSHLVVAEGSLDPGAGFVSSRIVAVSEDIFVASKYDTFCRQMREAGYHDFASTLRASDPAGLHRSAVSLTKHRSPTYRERLYKASMPRTFIFGERTLPHTDERGLALVGIDVRMVPDASHDMMGDNPQGFADAVADCIEFA